MAVFRLLHRRTAGDDPDGVELDVASARIRHGANLADMLGHLLEIEATDDGREQGVTVAEGKGLARRR